MHVNAAWLKSNPIPAEYSRWDTSKPSPMNDAGDGDVGDGDGVVGEGEGDGDGDGDWDGDGVEDV